MFENYFLEKYSKKLLLEITSSEYLSNYFSIENMSILFQISKVYSKCQEYFFYPSNVRSIFQLTRGEFFYYQVSGVGFFLSNDKCIFSWVQEYFSKAMSVLQLTTIFSIDTTAARSIFQLTREVFFSWQEKLSSH